ARLLGRKGQHAEAEALFEEVLTARRARYGSEHPLVADVLCGLAAFLGQRDDGRAEQLRRTADRLYRLGRPERNPTFAGNLAGWGLLALRRGEPGKAEELFAEVLPLHRKRYGDPSEEA